MPFTNLPSSSADTLCRWMSFVRIKRHFTLSALKIILTAFVLLSNGCVSTTRSGTVGVQRNQLMLVSSTQMRLIGERTYSKNLQLAYKQRVLDNDLMMFMEIKRIVHRLIPQTRVFRSDIAQWHWDVHVETKDEVNAYCLPGGKIMVYSGLIKKLNPTEDELAGVIGHEIAHALREHSRERISIALAKNTALNILGSLTSTGLLLGQAASLVTDAFLSLPNSRTQETEADRMGLEIMARAGYNPNAMTTFWEKMNKLNQGAKPPELLSTHPSDSSRMADIRNYIPRVMPVYENAKKML